MSDSAQEPTTLRDTAKPKVSPEFAAEEFDKLVEAWDLNMMVENDPDGQQALNDIRSLIIGAISKGSATIDGGGDLHFKCRHSPTFPELHFQVPKAEVWLRLDRHKENQVMLRTFEMVGGMTNQPGELFIQCDGRDFKLIQAVTGLFLTR